MTEPVLIVQILAGALIVFLGILASRVESLTENLEDIDEKLATLDDRLKVRLVVPAPVLQPQAKAVPPVNAIEVDPFTVDDVLAELEEHAVQADRMVRHNRIEASQPDAEPFYKRSAAAYQRNAAMIRYAASVVREKAASVEAAS